MAWRAFVFQLYRTKRVRHLHARIDLAAAIHNHLIAVQKRYYRRFNGYIGYYRLKRHVARVKQWRRFAHWRTLDAQAMQHIVWRIDQGYQRFFQSLKESQSRKAHVASAPSHFQEACTVQVDHPVANGLEVYEWQLCHALWRCIGSTSPGRSSAPSKR